MSLFTRLGVLACVVSAHLALARGPEAALSRDQALAAFEKVKSLEGKWQGQSTQGWKDTGQYRVIAGGSVVMHTSFDAHPGQTMATMFHMDGDRLLLTHYCIARNQPRLVATTADASLREITFEYLDGTGLTNRDQGHMDKLVLKIPDANHYTAHWTWYQSGQESWMEEIGHTRVQADEGADAQAAVANPTAVHHGADAGGQHAAHHQPDHAQPADDGAKAAPKMLPAEELAALSWLAGSWRGPFEGRDGAQEYVEEWWSQPVGTSIMGAFRWVNPDGTPRMFELLAITKEAEGVFLRLRHIDAKGVSWEEKDKPMTMKLKESAANRAVFERTAEGPAPYKVIYERTANVLAISVIFPEESGTAPLEFRLTHGG